MRTTPDAPTAPAVVQRYAVVSTPCSHCERVLGAELELLDGVEHVDVDLSTGRVTVASNGPLNPAAVAQVVGAVGFEMAS